MPTQLVDIDLKSETGAVARQTYSDLVLVGRDPDVSDPTYNEPLSFDSAASVESEFGEDSDVYRASKEVESRGVSDWWVVMLESSEHQETIGDSDTESADAGVVENTPIRGGIDNITVELDGDELDVVPTTETEPEKPDSGEAAVNFDTGEVKTGESSDGSSTGIEVFYETLSWDDAFTEMSPKGLDLGVLANTHADRSYIGELDEFLQHAESENMSIVVAYENGDEYDDDEEAMEAAHDIGGYIPSGSVLPIAHKSKDDVAAGVAGRLATKEPWFNPYMDGGADYSFSMDEYRRSLIGSPNTPGKFEGGDDDGEGPCNVLHTEMGVQILSNSLSTAGESSNYQYFDVRRTEHFIVNETRNALKTLRMSRESIPFAPIGRTLIENALRKTLNPYVATTGRALSEEEVEALRQAAQDEEEDVAEELERIFPERRASNHEANVPLSELDIHVPRYDDLSRQDRANRRWSGIQITAQIAGNAHTFAVEMAVQV